MRIEFRVQIQIPVIPLSVCINIGGVVVNITKNTVFFQPMFAVLQLEPLGNITLPL